MYTVLNGCWFLRTRPVFTLFPFRCHTHEPPVKRETQDRSESDQEKDLVAGKAQINDDDGEKDRSQATMDPNE